MKSSEKRAFIAMPVILGAAVGVALAGSASGAIVFGAPLFALCFGLAFLIQWMAFVPAFLKKTEKFYDLTGSITYFAVAIFAIVFSPAPDFRAYVLVGLVLIWAARLGSFLFSRIQEAGEDRRFREIKQSFWRFLMTWTIQGLWVSFSLAAALAAITSTSRIEFGPYAITGAILWLLGFAIEVVADQQKRQFRANRENKGKYISSGLWSWSRHPNYFGEIVLWSGIAVMALPVLSGWQYLTLISPVFVYVLLTKISGIPMLEKSADERWGGQEAYEDYKDQTSILFPLPPSDRSQSVEA